MNEDYYGLKEVHDYYLSMMDDFHEYCLTHNIQYSLSGGSLLGAVRHQGFIPWDDDFDVMFDRENYELFLDSFSYEPMNNYEIIGKSWVKRVTKKDNPEKDFEKRCLDLFVFDSVPANIIVAKSKVLFLKMLQGMLKDEPDYSRFSFPYKCLLFFTWIIGRPFSKEIKVKWYNNLSKIGNRYKKINIYNTWFNQIGRTEFDKEIIDGYIYVDFEGRKYFAIQGYDQYLTELYGDYMKLPPKEQRVPTHMKG